MEIERFGNYKCRITQRQTYNGRELKPNAHLIEGQELDFEVMWLMDDEDPYPNEWAMSPIDRAVRNHFYELGYGWIASGDLEILEKISG